MKRQLMAEQWDQFSRAILQPNCSQIQKQEMRRAFYAGAQSILFKVIESFAPEEEPTEADMQMMNDLHTELNAFAVLVKEGKA